MATTTNVGVTTQDLQNIRFPLKGRNINRQGKKVWGTLAGQYGETWLADNMEAIQECVLAYDDAAAVAKLMRLRKAYFTAVKTNVKGTGGGTTTGRGTGGRGIKH